MRRYFTLCLWAVFTLLINAGIYICAIADDQNIKNILQVNFDKLPYDDSRQKYYEVVIQSVWKASWRHESGDSNGIYIQIYLGKKIYIVPIAPSWYLDSKQTFKSDEKITIFGAETIINGKNIILPKLIKTGSGDLWLRNYDGKPFWLITSKNGALLKKGNPPGGQKGQGGPPGGGGGRPSF
jgi:hypothetical protein